MMRAKAWFFSILVSAALCSGVQGATVDAGNGFRATWEGQAIRSLSVRGKPLPGVAASFQLVDPRTKASADPAKFRVEAKLAARNGALWLDGVVVAAGTEDTVVDLNLRMEGVTLPLGDGVENPLLLPARLLNKLPIASLRTLATGSDDLGIGLHADRLCVAEFRALPEEKAVTLRFPFGFSRHARPEMRMRAPFSVVLYPTDPRWHFRSALAGYYRLFPDHFQRRTDRHGGWFFANETKNIPNPQHYAFHEGEGAVEEDHDRNMGMYPYNETGSETIQLTGTLPANYEEAIRRMEELERQQTPAAWDIIGGALDEQVKRSGRYCFRGAITEAKGGNGFARQFVLLDQPVNEPVVVSGWSRAENIKAPANPNDYSIYVDARCADGSWMFGRCALFRPGTHDWERSEVVITPHAPLLELRVYAMLRNTTGTAWFDDFKIHRQSRPEENLLPNAGWEEMGKRDDIQFVRDNAQTDPQGRYRVLITDHWGSDVRPTTPLALLRFICNVDPDLRHPGNRLTPAQRGVKLFDSLFAANPKIDGAYIDGAGAWSCWNINHRPDHFQFANHALTYDPATFVVGAHGKFAGYEWLRFIQKRYHPMGKTILGNMGPTTEAWPSYTGLDIIGIESSHFRDRALMAYHRYGGYQKPVLTMNFINLHKLDDRPTAEEFVLASAQFGHFPSTGRMVREGYRDYGDVCHTYYPALKEMSEAGWEPEPLVTGSYAERFGRGEVVYLTLRAPVEGRQVELTLLNEARAGARGPVVVMDAVQLAPVEFTPTQEGIRIRLVQGAEELTILRISSRENAERWLLERAARHCENAAIVRGRSENTDRLKALGVSVRGLKAGDAAGFGKAVAAIRAEKAKVLAEEESLERTSITTELLDAERALAEWVLFTGNARLTFEGEGLRPVTEVAAITPRFQPAKSGATLVSAWAGQERNILRWVSATPPAGAVSAGQAVSIQRDLPGAMHLCAALSVPVAGQEPISVYRVVNIHFTRVVSVQVKKALSDDRQSLRYILGVQRLAGPMPLRVKAEAEGIAIEPRERVLGPEEKSCEFRVNLSRETTEVKDVSFRIETAAGKPIATAASEFRNIPPPPEGDVALASKGAKVTADSSYSRYRPEPAIDGVWDTSRLAWWDKAWASRDTAGTEHWLEVQLPQPMPLSEVWIYWALDDNQIFASRNYDVEIWENNAWKSVVQVRNAPVTTVSQHAWPVTTTSRVRIRQLPGGGPAQRPHIMWISEVCLYNRGTLN